VFGGLVLQIQNWRNVIVFVILAAMENKRLEIKVGLFVLIALILLGVLVIQFSKSTSIFHGTYGLRLHSETVSGLKLRAAVLLSGVQIGSVSDIKLAEDGRSVTIFLKIYNGNKIYHDARFVIAQAGFLGDQFVAIIPTKNELPVLGNGADVNCEPPFDLREVARSASGLIQRVDDTAKKLDEAVTDLRRVVLNGQTLTNFSIAISNVRAFTEQAMNTFGDINALVATNGVQFTIAVSNLTASSQQLSHLAASADLMFTTNGEIGLAAKNIESSTETLKQLMNDIRSGKGLAGTLLQNQQVATNVQDIAYNLSVTTSNLNRLGLWGMLWHKEPARTNSSASEPKP
jgi:phospholipid/cholesterol/gamma-HCH transport system substrate-binding protein